MENNFSNLYTVCYNDMNGHNSLLPLGHHNVLITSLLVIDVMHKQEVMSLNSKLELRPAVRMGRPGDDWIPAFLPKILPKAFTDSMHREKNISMANWWRKKENKWKGLKNSSLLSHLFHDLHDHGPGSCEDEVTDCPVVHIQHIQPIDRHHKLTHLENESILFTT